MIEWIVSNLFRIVVLILFSMVVAFDLKTRKIPSIFTTGIILFIAVININHISYGVIAFIFAWMLYEAEFLDGIADVKLITALGLMIPDVWGIISLVAGITIVGAIYTSMIKSFTKIKEIPFTPIILAAYIGLWYAGII